MMMAIRKLFGSIILVIILIGHLISSSRISFRYYIFPPTLIGIFNPIPLLFKHHHALLLFSPFCGASQRLSFNRSQQSRLPLRSPRPVHCMANFWRTSPHKLRWQRFVLWHSWGIFLLSRIYHSCLFLWIEFIVFPFYV